MASRALQTFVKGFHDMDVISKMPYRNFGASERLVSAFSYGASALGGVFTDGKIHEDEAIHTVRETIKRGVNLVDAAPWYGFGQGERVLGKALQGVPRSAYYLHTKVGRYEADILKRFDFSYDRTLQSIDESLQRLGVDYIDTIQVHDPEFAHSLDIILTETLPALIHAKKLGKVKSIGITGYPLEVLRWLTENIDIPLASVISYSHYTLHDQTLATSGILQLFKRKGMGVINASPLSMGLLTKGGPPGWHPAHDQLKHKATEAVAYCDAIGTDISRLALGFSLSNAELDTVMGSYATLEEMRANLAIVTGATPLTPAENAAISHIKSKIFGKLGSLQSWEGLEVDKYWIKVGKTLLPDHVVRGG